MSILTALRNRVSTREASADRSGDAQGDRAAEAGVPFAGYERLDTRQVVDGLRDHSQVELEAIEGYERSHKDREPVLDKLRWMRGSEPMPGYDALSREEIATALSGADLATIKGVRRYERKFANRRDVMEGVAGALHDREQKQSDRS